MKRKHIVALVIFLIVYVLASVGGEGETRSSFSFSPSGTKAVHDLFEEMELPVVWWRKPFPLLPEELPSGSALLLIAPSESLEKVKELLSWVEQGNRLIVFGYGGATVASDPLDELWLAMKIHPDRFRLSSMVDDLAEEAKTQRRDEGPSYWEDIFEKLWTFTGPTRVETVEFSVSPPGGSSSIDAVTKGVRKLQLGKSGLIEASPLDFEELLKSKKKIPPLPLPKNAAIRTMVKGEKSSRIMQRDWGAGDIWIFADSAIIENEYIDQEDNLRLIYQLVSNSEAIAFDEFHHGYIEPAPEQVRGKRDALLVFIGFLAFCLAAISLSRSLRFGPASPKPNQDVASSTEFATALGLLCKDYRAQDLLRYYRDLWLKRVSRLVDCKSEAGERMVLDRAVEKNLLTKEQRQEAERLLLEFAKTETPAEAQVLLNIESLERLIATSDNDKRV